MPTRCAGFNFQDLRGGAVFTTPRRDSELTSRAVRLAWLLAHGALRVHLLEEGWQDSCADSGDGRAHNPHSQRSDGSLIVVCGASLRCVIASGLIG